MYRITGVESAPNLAAPILTLEGEPIRTRVPVIPAPICPHCGGVLYDGKILTVRTALLRQLEVHISGEPTETRALCFKLLHAPDVPELENAELERLKAAVKANGFDYRDWVQGLLDDYLETATKVEEPGAAPES